MAKVMRVNVSHNGLALTKGSPCPENLLKIFENQGLLEDGPESVEVAPVAEAAEVKASAPRAEGKAKKGKSLQ